VAVHGDKAIAYVCNGSVIEATDQSPLRLPARPPIQ
jgi:hypothetical protein